MASIPSTTETSYIAVTKLAGAYSAVRYDGNSISFIDSTTFTDKRMTEAGAKIFARKENLPFRDNIILEIIKPILLAYSHANGKWYPAITNKDNFQVIYSDKGKDLGKCYCRATKIAEIYAEKYHMQFLSYPLLDIPVGNIPPSTIDS